MCGIESTRRQFVGGAIAAAAAGLAGCAQRADAPEDALPPARPQPALAPVEVADGLFVRPRDDWGADLPPTGPLRSEDARFLLVHHTATSNVIPDPRALIRNVYAFHTGPAKRWPDVAYNFFVGPDGSVWEARAGSLAGPVVADATGGNQGFAQLVCLLGTFTATAPTAAAQDSLTRLLAHLAIRDGLSTWGDASATFESRGSNRWPQGTTVTTSTISGHRDMSATACPGDVAYGLLPHWRREVHARVSATWRRAGLQRATRLVLEAP